MSENSSKIASKLTKVESKLKKLQESHNTLIKNYDTLKKEYLKLAACHKEIETQKDEINLNELDVEMIPLDVDENLKDPIEFLPEHCAVEILKNLTGKELMTSMEVSKLWRDFIKVQSVLMDKIVFKPTNKSCDFLMNGINDGGNLRRYKHYEGPSYIYNKYEEVFEGYIKSGFNKVYPIELYASSLETAVMKSPSEYYKYHKSFNGDYNYDYCCEASVCPHAHLMEITQNFAQLQKLTFPVNRPEPPLTPLTFPGEYYGASLSMLKAAKFPMLTYLKLTQDFPDNDINICVDDFKEFLCLFPKLQTLVFKLNYRVDFTGYRTTVHNVPKIKEFSCIYDCLGLLNEFHSSLERYEVYNISAIGLRDVLKDFKRLKSLSIVGLIDFYGHNEDEMYEINQSIEALYIFGIDESDNCFMDILVALPSVKKLFYGELSVPILEFIANNMLNLKQVGCPTITDELRETYEEIRRHPENYLNTDFELIDNMPWDKIQNDYESD